MKVWFWPQVLYLCEAIKSIKQLETNFQIRLFSQNNNFIPNFG